MGLERPVAGAAGQRERGDRDRRVSESWVFPEAANDGHFAVEVDTGSGFGGRFDVAVAAATLPGGVNAARVAEIGADGRTGPWVSIGTGTS